MIQANELRIGNWVNVDIRHTVVTVDKIEQINTDGIIIAKDIFVTFSILKPIPITPEILEKCGFEITTEKERWATWTIGLPDLEGIHIEGNAIRFAYKKPLILHYIKLNWMFIFNHDAWVTGIKLEFLHQLQNIYFALTNTELEINL